MTRGDHALGEHPQILQRDVRGVRIEPAKHVADDAYRPGTAESLQPAELAESLVNGFELQPHRRAGALEALFGDLAVVEARGAQPDADPAGKLSSSMGLKASPITTSVEPPPMSITSRLSEAHPD